MWLQHMGERQRPPESDFGGRLFSVDLSCLSAVMLTPGLAEGGRAAQQVHAGRDWAVWSQDQSGGRREALAPAPAQEPALQAWVPHLTGLAP